MSGPDPSLAELVGSLALATDLAMGHPIEQGLGACIISTRLGELAGLSDEELRRTYYLSLLRHIGCTTERQGLAKMVGDEIRLSGILDPLSGGRSSEYIAAFFRFVMEGKPPLAKAGAVAHLMGGMRGFNAAQRAICEVAQMLAARLGFDEPFVAAVATVYERWDGKGFPNKVRGEAIPLPVRLTQVADLASALHDLGHDDPAAVVERRSGSGFDPEVAELFLANAPDLLSELDVTSRWEVTQKLDPDRLAVLSGGPLDEALGAVADFADLQSPYLIGHSSGVAFLAHAAGLALGLPASALDDVRRAALIHDLGRVGVSAALWAKKAALTAGEWEAVRLHPYHTDRVFCRAPSLNRLSVIASMHHERLDGSGYFKAARADQLPEAVRLLAAADVYHAMTEPRPHRGALPPDRAADEIQGEVRAGRLDRRCVDAVLAAAGHRVGRRQQFVAGLTSREVEVLRLLARALSTKEIARTLVISPKTADHHIQSIYTKAGVASRAAAAVFAMQHGLVDTLAP